MKLRKFASMVSAGSCIYEFPPDLLTLQYAVVDVRAQSCDVTNLNVPQGFLERVPTGGADMDARIKQERLLG
jgi:hypothetical protein